MTEHLAPACGYSDDDAAYVLGALEPAEQQAFRAHLPGCARCRDAVTELAVMPGLLARLLPGTDPTTVASTEAGTVAGIGVGTDPPAPLLPTLVRRVRAERRRAGWRSRLTGFVVAAALGVATFLGLPEPTAPAPAAAAAPDRVLVMAASPGVPVAATLLVTGRGWGTSIDTRCRYEDTADSGGGADGEMAMGDPRYELWAIDSLGAEELISSWHQLPGGEITVPGSTGLDLDDIDRLELRSGAGMTLLVSRP